MLRGRGALVGQYRVIGEDNRDVVEFVFLQVPQQRSTFVRRQRQAGFYTGQARFADVTENTAPVAAMAPERAKDVQLHWRSFVRGSGTAPFL